MFEKVTHETLTDDINIAEQEGKILTNSAIFLKQKLNELSQSDNELTDNEIEIIEKQLGYHKKMAELKSDFDIKKSLMRNILRKQISTTLSQMNNQSIVDTDLLDLECKLEQGLFNDSRDIIDDKVNNTDLSVEGLTDGFLNWESLGKIDGTNNFINYFTLELLNNNILVDESRNNINGQITFTSLSKAQIEKYVHNTVEYLVRNGLELPDNIEIDINNIFVSVDLLKIKNDILISIEAEKQRAEELRLQEEREKNKQYLIGLLEDIFSGTIDSQGLDVLQRKFGYSGNLDNGENEGYVGLLNNYVNEGLINQQYILDLYDNGKITKIILLNYLEQDENFNYLRFIESYGLTQRVQDQGLRYAREVLKLNPTKYPDELILKNLQIFVSIFLYIESKGLNVINQQGSSAKGYFQFLTLDGTLQKVKDGQTVGDLKGGSFQTGLNRLKWVLPREEFLLRFGEQDRLKERDQNPMELSAENQTMLFFANITGKDLFITNYGFDLNNDGAISDKESIINVGNDNNNDGIISGKETKFKGVDINNNGIVSYDERVRYLYGSKDLNKNGRIDKSEVKITGKWVDLDNDGFFQDNEKIENDPREVARFMSGVLKDNNEWSLGKIYKALHHTNPTKATLRVFKETIDEYYYGNKKYIAKNHY